MNRRKHVKRSFASDFSRDAREGHLRNRKLEEKLPGTNIPICIHDEYCLVKRTLNKAHCSEDYAKTCQTAKFYLRYGEGYNQLGVGASLNPIKSKLDKLFREDMRDF